MGTAIREADVRRRCQGEAGPIRRCVSIVAAPLRGSIAWLNASGEPFGNRVRLRPEVGSAVPTTENGDDYPAAGGLEEHVTEAILRAAFIPFGVSLYVLATCTTVDAGQSLHAAMAVPIVLIAWANCAVCMRHCRCQYSDRPRHTYGPPFAQRRLVTGVACWRQPRCRTTQRVRLCRVRKPRRCGCSSRQHEQWGAVRACAEGACPFPSTS